MPGVLCALAFLTFSFGHDADGRLASSVVPDRGLEAYEADAAGNVPAAPVRLPQLPVPDGGLEGGSDLEDGRVVAVRVAEGWTLGYDADGNLRTKSDASGRHGGTAWRYVYDAAGRLAEVWRDDGAGELRVGAYGYDVLGRRVTRQTWALDGSGLEERTVWDGDVPAERRRASRSASSSRAGGLEVASVRTFAYEGFEPVALLDGLEGAAVLECDQVGQPRLAVDREGALVWEGRFDAWGADLEVGPIEDGGLEVDARFPGQVADDESGLRYNRFRYYDPGTRAYTQADLIGLRGGQHPQNYVVDPLHWADPLGLSGCNVKRRASNLWNQFQSRSAGMFRSRGDAATAWADFRAGRFDDLSHRLDFSSPKDGAVFWSGGTKNEARQHALSTGGTTLEMTPGGRLFDDWDAVNDLYPWPESKGLWESLSSRYAEGASGRVTAVIREGGPSPTSIWTTVERPILKGKGIKPNKIFVP